MQGDNATRYLKEMTVMMMIMMAIMMMMVMMMMTAAAAGGVPLLHGVPRAGGPGLLPARPGAAPGRPSLPRGGRALADLAPS